MDEQKVIKYWLTAALQDFETVELLYKNKKYHHALFFCHLTIEKMLKALVVKATKKAPPLSHDLLRLAEKAEIPLTEQYKNDLAELSTFNIAARYDDYKLSFYKKATKDFTAKYFNKTRELIKWLKAYV